ncbi:SPASM domain-containing protein [Candidatus Sumerlaeota bacterium]|nr:SPASM domain-containing protein [Candidatus Sumerlaeota bacterium]
MLRVFLSEAMVTVPQHHAIPLDPDPGEYVVANPVHVWIEPTNRCNTRCRHCDHFYRQFGEDMPHSLYEKIKRDVLPDVKRAELIGYGEPFMGKHFWEMFDDCAQRGIEMYTTSNGILLRDDGRVSKVVRNDITLCLSVDGARPETFERVRPYIKWRKLIETLACLKKNADEAGPEKKFRLRFNFCAMKHNIGDLPDIVRLAHKYGCSGVLVLPFSGEEIFHELAGQSAQQSPELVSSPYLEALRLGAVYGITVDIPDSFLGLIVQGASSNGGVIGKLGRIQRRTLVKWYRARRHGLVSVAQKLLPRKSSSIPRSKPGLSYCTMPWNDAYFASDGTVYPCCIMIQKLGDMNTQPWEEIRNGIPYRTLRRTVHSWNPSRVCRNCGLPTGINGGDGHQYEKFFARFRTESIAMDAPGVHFEGGFYPLEQNEGTRMYHVWMGKRGEISIPTQPGAKFLRIEILERAPVHDMNPGVCRINNLPEEPFDNSCSLLHFPIQEAEGPTLKISLAMLMAHTVPPDTRALSLAIKGLAFLH